MLYLRSFNRFILFGLTLLGLSISPANAALMKIEATGVALGTTFYGTDFTILYDDVSGDGLLQVSELTSFSGSSLNAVSDDSVVYDILSITGTTNIAGVSTASGDHGSIGNTLNWAMMTSYLGQPPAIVGIGAVWWSYTNTAVSAVPVPAAVWLFGTALVGFVGLSRRRKVA